ncbi:avidin-like [Dendropsophus ebraccatus]|uniref:avidin-like n=1 Tax=Dendropsophus ebraccatus TaxID=150705 RepID=UPI003831563E
MTQVSVLAVLLSCLSICAAAKPKECDLTGQWMNDLGSDITISDIKTNGAFSGTYLTAVSATNNFIRESPVTGYQQNNSSTFGFTVKWTFSDSITVFTGQCFLNETGHPVLKTTWLLRSETENIRDDWKQTRVGYNIFHKLPTKQ